MSSYEEEEEEDEEEEVHENNETLEKKSRENAAVNLPDNKSPSEFKTKVSTELARRMLQKNLERLLLNQTESCKDVISQLTGTMTAKQVEKLVEKTNLELQGAKNKPQASCIHIYKILFFYFLKTTFLRTIRYSYGNLLTYG